MVLLLTLRHKRPDSFAILTFSPSRIAVLRPLLTSDDTLLYRYNRCRFGLRFSLCQHSIRSPGVRRSAFYGSSLCIYVVTPVQYGASVCLATSPALPPPYIQFLFVSPHICRQLPSDSQSPATPLLLANPSYCKVGSGLAPYS